MLPGTTARGMHDGPRACTADRRDNPVSHERSVAMKFSGILIGSENAPRLAAYYTKLFGPPGWDDGGYVGWVIRGAAITVGPHDQVHGSNTEPGRIIWNIESDDVKADFERFKAAGVIVVREPYNFEDAPEAWIATLADPDGNYFQLVSPMTM
jgi:predicted enzyme related to lactoylglutathione lyase